MIGDELQALADRTLEILDTAGCDMRGGGERWRGTCPLCGERDLSLNVDLGRRRLWLDCWHATCDWQAIHEVLGITKEDLRLGEDAPGGELVRRSFDQIKFEPVTFLVEDRVPLQGLTLLVGDPFAGKSTWSALLAAGVTTGAYGDPGVVAILNAEDATAVTTGPRVKAAGGDLALVEELTVRVASDYEQVITLPDDVPKLEAWVVETGARLLILDPLMMFLTERADAHQDHGIRRALASLAMMAERRHLAVVVAAHLNKDAQKQMLYRVGGSIGIVGLARSVLFLAHDPDDPDGEDGDLRLLAHAASNWSKRAPTLRYRIEVVTLIQDGQQIVTTKLVVDGESEYSAEELIAPRRPQESTKTKLAEDAICQALQNGPKLSSEVKSAVMTAVGCALVTVDRAAMQLRLAQVIGTEGKGPAARWHLLDEPPHDEPCHPSSDDDDEVVGTPLRARARMRGDSEQLHHHDLTGDDTVAEAPDEAVPLPGFNGSKEGPNRAEVEAELRRRRHP